MNATNGEKIRDVLQTILCAVSVIECGGIKQGVKSINKSVWKIRDITYDLRETDR